MYFVTSKNPDYVLFCMTPSERGAIGLTEHHVVHLLRRLSNGQWEIIRQWSSGQYSHTDFMVSLAQVEEPADPADLVRYLPSKLRT